ncbi:hypothetical protein GC167_04585 [bacterium]|nr:hypothetical protein [bacterium]
MGWENLEGELLLRVVSHRFQQGSPPPESAEAYGASDDGVANQIAYRIARLAQFARHYLKSVLETTPVGSPEEFGMLMALYGGRSVNKSALIREQVMEIPTGMDILKRLMHRNLVELDPEQTDRRSKKVRLTETGIRTVEHLFFVIGPAGRLVSAALDPSQKEQVLGLLERLDRFHTDLMGHPGWPRPEELLKAQNPGDRTVELRG